MTGKCCLLFKIQLKNELGRGLKSRERIAAALTIASVICVLVIYAFLLSYGLGFMGMANVIPSYSVAITCLVILFFTVLKANGVLFAYREYDLLMSLPVRTGTVIASRFLTMYALNLLLSAAIMIPMGIGYVIWVRPGPMFYISFLLGIFTTPFIPTTLAAFIGMLILLFSMKFRHSRAVATVASLAAMLALILLPFNLAGGDGSSLEIDQLKTFAVQMLDRIHTVYPPALLFYRGIDGHNFVSILCFMGISLIWYYIFIKLISAVYKKLNTAMTTSYVHSDYKLTDLKAASQLKALYTKELKRFLSSTTYCLNMGMGSILVIAVSAALLLVSNEKLGLMSKMTNILPFCIATLSAATCTTCVSLSLEGKNIWIIKSMPVEALTVFKSKILLNLSLQIPPVLLAAILLNFRFRLSPVMRCMIFITPVMYSVFDSLWCMLINLKMPDYEWTSEFALIKQSLPSMAGLLSGILAGVILTLTVLLLQPLGAGLVTIIITVLLGILSWFLWKSIKKQRI